MAGSGPRTASPTGVAAGPSRLPGPALTDRRLLGRRPGRPSSGPAPGGWLAVGPATSWCARARGAAIGASRRRGRSDGRACAAAACSSASSEDTVRARELRPPGRPQQVVAAVSAARCPGPRVREPLRGQPVPSGSMSAQFIFTMRKVSRFHPPDREVLKDITLSFYPGAKIGVLGANGAGKSSLLRIMAGRRRRLHRRGPAHARASPSACSSRSRSSTRPRTCIGNVMDGVGETADAARADYDEVLAGWADPDADYEKLGDRAGRPRGQDRGRRRLGPRAHRSRSPWTRCACPPGDADVDHAVGRRAAPGRAVPAAAVAAPTCCCSTSPPTTSTPSRWRGSSASCSDYAGTVVAITHDRYFLDNVAGWILELDRGRGIPFEGNYSGWLEQKQARLGAGGEGRLGPPAHARARARVGAHGAQGPPGQGQGPPRRLREAAGRGRGRRAAAPTSCEIIIPPGPPPGRPGHRGRAA